MIAIIDYGLGNIKAFANIYHKLNVECKIARSTADLEQVTKIILPGVGAFDYAITLLNQSGMRQTLDYLVLTKKTPILGICVGMQILAQSSEEGNLPGLSWIDGRVKKITLDKLKPNEPLPHMGWNNIHKKHEHPILKNLADQSYFYFLHSYYFSCNNADNILTTTHYGLDFSSIIASANIYGIQCHPEKSHQNGITLLENFGKL